MSKYILPVRIITKIDWIGEELWNAKLDCGHTEEGHIDWITPAMSALMLKGQLPCLRCAAAQLMPEEYQAMIDSGLGTKEWLRKQERLKKLHEIE